MYGSDRNGVCVYDRSFMWLSQQTYNSIQLLLLPCDCSSGWSSTRNE